MLKDIQASWRFNRNDNIGATAIYFSIFLMGEVIYAAVRIFAGAQEYVSIGLILAALAAIFIPMVCGVSQYSAGFFLAVKSGATRRKYMLGQTVMMLVQSALYVFYTVVCAGISLGIHRLFYSGSENIFKPLGMVPIWAYFACILVTTTLGLIFGALLAKFGKKASFAFLFLYFVVLFVSARLPDAIKTGGTNAIDKGLATVSGWIVAAGFVPVAWVCVGILVALSAVAYLVMLRAPVTE